VLAEARAKYYKGASTGPTTSPAAPALKISSQPEVREAKVEVGETPESAGLESLARELGVTVGALQEVTELLAARPGDIVTAAQQQLAINKVLEPSLNAHAEVKAKRYRAEIVAVANMHMDQILKGYAKLSKCLGEIEPLRAGLVAPLSSALSNTLLPLLKVKDGLALLAADVAVPAHRPRKAWLQTAAQELKRLGASHSEILLVLQNKNLVLPSYSTENVRDLLRPARERKPRGRIGKK
jgi:hypothetical protein